MRTSAPGVAATLYEYNQLGEIIRSGVDVNDNGSLDDASDDRISVRDDRYILEDGSWWRTSEQAILPESNTSTPKTVARDKIRLTGLGAGLIEEQVATDIHGNQTTVSRHLDRSTHTVTTTTTSPSSATDSVTVERYGLPVSTTDHGGLTTTYSYDALDRKIGETDPRTGLHTIHYDDKGQVDYTEDPEQRRTSYGYDLLTGRKSAVTDAENRTTYFLYNSLDQITHTWGAGYPVRYVYDTYGHMTEMHTYRTTAGWDGATWPAANDSLADTTRYHYHEPSGLLEAKEDASGNSTTYTYSPGGRLQTRSWARTPAGTSLVTTYSHDPATGLLTTINYSDATPDIGFTYYRTDLQESITDATGTWTLTYTDELQPESETLTGPLGHTITRNYTGTGVPGRYAGFTLASDYVTNYGYDTYGRLDSVDWNIDGNTDTVQYGYLDNSHLPDTLSFNSGTTIAYRYEAHRDLKTQIRNSFNTTAISQYDYVYDNIGRRTSMTTSGDLFDSPPLPVSPDTALIERAVTYTPNALNQYETIEEDATVITPLHDEDGNLTTDQRFTYSCSGNNRVASLLLIIDSIF